MTILIQILKGCPKGRNLYSPLYGEVELDYINSNNGSIYAKYPNCGNNLAVFNEEGQVWGYETGECMLFPSSDEKSWNYWQSVVFEKGDIITRDGFINSTYLYDGFNVDGYYGFTTDNKHTWLDVENFRFATSEEMQQFLNDTKGSGYKYNDETKVLEILNQWTLQDAKRGDILYGEVHGSNIYRAIFIYSGHLLEDTTSPDYTCALDGWGLQVFNEIALSKTKLSPETIRPATVNERVNLLEAIKNNGYEVTSDNRVIKASVVEEITCPEPIKLYNKENLAKELETIFNIYGIDTRLNMRDYLIADHIIKYIDNLEELLKQQI
jgi:hypothetical protein